LVEPRPVLAVGTAVEVRNRFVASWSGDFEIAERTGNGYRVKRRSDGYVLPTVFGPGEVREVGPSDGSALTTRPEDRTSRVDGW
jgi:hypothetical protein